MEAATDVAARDMMAKYDVYNPAALKRLVASQDPAQAVLQGLMDIGFKTSMEVFAEHEAKSPEFKKIHQDMRAFQRTRCCGTASPRPASTASWQTVKL